MKKYLYFFISCLVIISCTISLSPQSFDDQVGTQVGIAFTTTALEKTIQSGVPVIEFTLTPTSTITPQSTATLPVDDPVNELGEPSWRDDLSSGRNWNLDDDEIVFGNTHFFQKDGMLYAVSDTTKSGYIWYLSYLEFQNAYLEAKFEVDQCRGDDQYGLVFRAADYSDGIAYYYTITCDGHYDLRRWTSSGSTLLLQYPEASEIKMGSDQINSIGVWVKENRIRLYINDQFVREIEDNAILNKGHFGIFINAKQTPGLTVKMDEIAYWLLN